MLENNAIENASGKREIGAMKTADRNCAVTGLLQILKHGFLGKGPNPAAGQDNQAQSNGRSDGDYDAATLAKAAPVRETDDRTPRRL